MTTKEKLTTKLNEDDRKISWFWRKYVRTQTKITYAYLNAMLNDPERMRNDVAKIINQFLTEATDDNDE